MIDLSNYFGSLAALAGLSVIITGYINTKILTSGNSTWKQVVSWCVAIALCFIGSAKGIGIVADAGVLWTVLTGLAVGLVSNGIFDVGLVQSLLTFIGAKKE